MKSHEHSDLTKMSIVVTQSRDSSSSLNGAQTARN